MIDSGESGGSSPAVAPSVLLVEDEPFVALIAEDLLRMIGFEPTLAASAAAALNALQSGLKPHFAMVDMGLPDASGDDLVRRLRHLSPGLPVLIVSGYDEGELRARFAGDRAVGILTKPYSEADLRRATLALGVVGLAV